MVLYIHSKRGQLKKTIKDISLSKKSITCIKNSPFLLSSEIQQINFFASFALPPFFPRSKANDTSVTPPQIKAAAFIAAILSQLLQMKYVLALTFSLAISSSSKKQDALDKQVPSSQLLPSTLEFKKQG